MPPLVGFDKLRPSRARDLSPGVVAKEAAAVSDAPKPPGSEASLAAPSLTYPATIARDVVWVGGSVERRRREDKMVGRKDGCQRIDWCGLALFAQTLITAGSFTSRYGDERRES